MDTPNNLHKILSCQWLGTGRGAHDPYWRIYGRDYDPNAIRGLGPWSGPIGHPYETRAAAIMAAQEQCNSGRYHGRHSCNPHYAGEGTI